MGYNYASVVDDLNSIKSQSPVILNLTNFVAMDLTANALLAIGASPIMANSSDELSELVQIAHAVVINIGTLDKTFIENISICLNEAQKWNKPVVFDPVGAGSSLLRTRTSQGILNHPALKVMRANASETQATLGILRTGAICATRENSISFSSKGVDSSLSSHDVFANTKEYTKQKDVVICVSGATDFVFSQKKIARIDHGDALMTRVTAMGCSATALIGAFLAVNSNAFEASLHAMITMGLSGEIAKKNSFGPGSFRVQFLDALSNLNSNDFHDLNVNFL